MKSYKQWRGACNPISRAARSREEQGSLRTQIHVDSRFIFQLMHELGIHLRARGSERLQNTRRLVSTIGQHAARRIGCLSPRFSTLHHQHRRALLAKLSGKAQPDNPASHDNDVPGFHRCIVEESREHRSTAHPEIKPDEGADPAG